MKGPWQWTCTDRPGRSRARQHWPLGLRPGEGERKAPGEAHRSLRQRHIGIDAFADGDHRASSLGHALTDEDISSEPIPRRRALPACHRERRLTVVNPTGMQSASPRTASPSRIVVPPNRPSISEADPSCGGPENERHTQRSAEIGRATWQTELGQHRRGCSAPAGADPPRPPHCAGVGRANGGDPCGHHRGHSGDRSGKTHAGAGALRQGGRERRVPSEPCTRAVQPRSMSALNNRSA